MMVERNFDEHREQFWGYQIRACDAMDGIIRAYKDVFTAYRYLMSPSLIKRWRQAPTPQDLLNPLLLCFDHTEQATDATRTFNEPQPKSGKISATIPKGH
jgi:hypothetical protein